MYAIIRDRGQQHKVSEGEVVQLDHMNGVEQGDALEFTEVLMTSNGEGEVQLGAPLLGSVKVSGEVVEPDQKGAKIDVVHFRRRKDSMTKRGHRQKYTTVKISKITAE